MTDGLPGRPLVYGSVCSGIEGAGVAWGPLGFRPAWLSEIDPFPCAVLAHRWPGVPNLGDFTRIGTEHGPIALLVGGTPCTSFSVTGLRRGLDDACGNLALEYLRLVDRLRPRWLLWENVPGVLSSGGGRDLGSLLGGLAQLGYGWAYRVLDAVHFGVPQRRRRLFLVGHRGGCWRRPAAVLFEPGGLSLDPRPGGPVGPPAAPGPGGLPGGRGRIFGWTGDTTPKYGVGVTPTLRASQGGEGVGLAGPFGVRRLTAVEAERLQGFPDGYTDVPFRGRPAGHAPRLKALGNSFAVPVVRWIGERIATVDSIPGGPLD